MVRAEQHSFYTEEFLSENQSIQWSLKSSTEESRTNYFQMALLKHLVEE